MTRSEELYNFDRLSRGINHFGLREKFTETKYVPYLEISQSVTIAMSKCFGEKES